MKAIFNQIWKLALPYQDKRDDTGHAEITLKYAKKLLTLEEADEDIVVPAIMLHDIGYSRLEKGRRLLVFDEKASKEDRRRVALEHQNESVKLAGDILRSVKYPDDSTKEILEIISQHDTREGFISKNEGLVRDADKLWRTSKEGFAAAEARHKSRDGSGFKKSEENINKPGYFFSETARKMALRALKSRMREQANQIAPGPPGDEHKERG